ncbi:MAG: hypothetical protein H8D87_04840 [Deltaproteobacteria bacterium]|nr:hypothetical protein [Candidatus Desulfobacula maris]
MAFIATPVAIWASGGAAAVAATGITAAGTLAGAVAAGIVTGAVIGAATAAITGGNILKGALMGAVVGGVSAGVVSGLGGAAGAGTAAGNTAGLVPGDAMYGAAAAGKIAPATGILATPTLDVNPSVSGGPNVLTSAPAAPTAQATPAAPVVQQPGGSWFSKLWNGMSPEVQAGVVKGGAEGLMKLGASMMESSSKKDLAEWQAREEDRKKASNKVSVDYEKKVANATIPQLWKNYTKVNTNVTTNVAV